MGRNKKGHHRDCTKTMNRPGPHSLETSKDPDWKRSADSDDTDKSVDYIPAKRRRTRGNKEKNKEADVVFHDASDYRKHDLMRIFENLTYADNRKSRRRGPFENRSENDVIDYVIKCLGMTTCRNAASLKTQVRAASSKMQLKRMEERRNLWAEVCQSGVGIEDEDAKIIKIFQYLDNFYGTNEADKPQFLDELKKLLNHLLPVNHPARQSSAFHSNLHQDVSLVMYSIFNLFYGHYSTKMAGEGHAMDITTWHNGACSLQTRFKDPLIPDVIQKFVSKADGMLGVGTGGNKGGQMPLIAVEVKTTDELKKEEQHLEKEGYISSSSTWLESGITSDDAGSSHMSSPTRSGFISRWSKSRLSSPTRSATLACPITMEKSEGSAGSILAPGQASTFHSPSVSGMSKNDAGDQRKGKKLYGLHTQHFIELYSILRLSNRVGYRSVVYGFYVVQNRIYPTCLRVLPVAKVNKDAETTHSGSKKGSSTKKKKVPTATLR